MSAVTPQSPRLSVAVCALLALMLASDSVVIARFVLLVKSDVEESGGRSFAFFLSSLVLAIAPTIVAVVLLFVGSRIFPIVATLAALLRAVEVFYGLDIVSVMVVLASVAVVVVAWLPSTRTFVAARRKYWLGKTGTAEN